ncbi:effector-binding domain-containing protein [Flavobacterium arsenatis]|uniref:Effector-binding domain-containing protein n=1 Tax=Flavobacterium arsenatis TaxID=1484332 RepID=A0ABU1TJG0_9FLAO|nr:hypothetical protein [Flavobacterium arsenatis]MDR6966121.1 effector-binding domain-containing protein [Flavobacterium arsenatis]
MKNQLSLHEAIVIALININKENFTASFKEIADFIEKRNLYPDRKGGIDLSTQVMLRSTKADNSYSYLFEIVGDDKIKIKNN